jgi:hypothetical protein
VVYKHDSDLGTAMVAPYQKYYLSMYVETNGGDERRGFNLNTDEDTAVPLRDRGCVQSVN